MPDKYGFDHLVWWGAVSHRCIECGWPEESLNLSEREREKHHQTHASQRSKAIDKQRKEQMAHAREALSLKREQ
jgi:hypothetical protein